MIRAIDYYKKEKDKSGKTITIHLEGILPHPEPKIAGFLLKQES